MIRLTINRPQLQPESLVFKKTTVTVGKGDFPHVDISLPGEHLREIHIQFLVLADRCVAVNVANDPFVMLNDRPFGKKQLTQGDCIQVDETIIRFDGFTISSEKPSHINDSTKIAEKESSDPLALHNVKTNTTLSDSPQSFHHVYNKQELDDEIMPTEHPQTTIFEFFLKTIRRKSIITAAGCLAILAIIFGLVTFINIANKSDEDSLIAAEGVADVAMALTYAQVNHIKPQKQNWVDPEFLTNNLGSILSSEHSSFANIDNQGQFRNCPYILRIYTSSDLSQFLVIAQPIPSMDQWLVPQPAIVVDSQAMELRRLNDLKPLNRQLVNASTLDGTNKSDITTLLEQGTLIPLTALGSKKGFTPPKALALVRPGAENRIYNAPRYYHFGETILKKAIALFQIVGSSHEVTRLQQQLQTLSQLPNIVLYSSQGLQKTMQAQQALSILAPNNKLLTAYLHFNNAGSITGGHLLFEGDYTKLSQPIQASLPQDFHPEITAMELPSGSVPVIVANQIGKGMNHQHPLFLQLSAMTKEREHSLKKISDAITTLLVKNNKEGVNNFSEKLADLVHQYQQADQELLDKISERLTLLYQEHPDMPLSQFAAYVVATGMEVLANQTLEQYKIDNKLPPISSAQIEALLQKIEEASTLRDLDQAVTTSAAQLNLTQLPEPERLIALQNELRNKTVQQLGRLLLSSQVTQAVENFRLENRALLIHILSTAWVTDPGQFNHYLNQFNLRLQEM